MIRVMAMDTGKIIEAEFGNFEDEVLNAEWTPTTPALQLGLQEVRVAAAAEAEIDTEAFLAAMYRSQQ